MKAKHPLSPSLTTILIASCLLFANTLVKANPVLDRVTAGEATIQALNNHQLTINQQSNVAYIDWKSFDIQNGETTQFNQPSVNSYTINKINTNKPSVINGALKANGNIFVLNPADILIDKQGTVDVHDLFASSLVNSHDGLKNKRIELVPGNPTASIINKGTITVADNGFAYLVAPGVENSGTINAKLDTVNLNSVSDTMNVDFAGDDLIYFSTTWKLEGPKSMPHRSDNGSEMSYFVNNTSTGAINAKGGIVSLDARQMENVVDHVINVSGEINAVRSSPKASGVIINPGKRRAHYSKARIDSYGGVNVLINSSWFFSDHVDMDDSIILGPIPIYYDFGPTDTMQDRNSGYIRFFSSPERDIHSFETMYQKNEKWRSDFINGFIIGSIYSK